MCIDGALHTYQRFKICLNLLLEVPTQAFLLDTILEKFPRMNSTILSLRISRQVLRVRPQKGSARCTDERCCRTFPQELIGDLITRNSHMSRNPELQQGVTTIKQQQSNAIRKSDLIMPSVIVKLNYIQKIKSFFQKLVSKLKHIHICSSFHKLLLHANWQNFTCRTISQFILIIHYGHMYTFF